MVTHIGKFNAHSIRFHDPADWYEMAACSSDLAVTEIELDEAFAPGEYIAGLHSTRKCT
jgi:hypothetical protein